MVISSNLSLSTAQEYPLQGYLTIYSQGSALPLPWNTLRGCSHRSFTLSRVSPGVGNNPKRQRRAVGTLGTLGEKWKAERRKIPAEKTGTRNGAF
jgi:hypothetical protein